MVAIFLLILQKIHANRIFEEKKQNQSMKENYGMQRIFLGGIMRKRTLQPVLGIRNILERTRIRGSVPLAMDPDPAAVPDPTQDPTLFFNNFEDVIFFFIFFI
jgi:hypothetical protein